MTRSYLFGPVFYTLTFILSFFSIEASLVFYALASLYFLIPAQWIASEQGQSATATGSARGWRDGV